MTETRGNETLCILKHARGLLVQGMCVGNSALNAKGNPASALSVRAVCWCPNGSIRRARFDLDLRESSESHAHAALERVSKRIWYGDMDGWKYRYIAAHEATNGEITLRMFDEAIAELEGSKS